MCRPQGHAGCDKKTGNKGEGGGGVGDDARGQARRQTGGAAKKTARRRDKREAAVSPPRSRGRQPPSAANRRALWRSGAAAQQRQAQQLLPAGQRWDARAAHGRPSAPPPRPNPRPVGSLIKRQRADAAAVTPGCLHGGRHDHGACGGREGWRWVSGGECSRQGGCPQSDKPTPTRTRRPAGAPPVTVALQRGQAGWGGVGRRECG